MNEKDLLTIFDQVYATPFSVSVDRLTERVEKLERLLRLLVLGDVRTLPGYKSYKDEAEQIARDLP